MYTYQENAIEILSHSVLRISFKDELAIDTGGVCRDMFSSFWEQAYLKNFDGETLLCIRTPKSLLFLFWERTILSHGYLVSGFMPVHVAFPVIAAVLLGLDITISDVILLWTFLVPMRAPFFVKPLPAVIMWHLHTISTY